MKRAMWMKRTTEVMESFGDVEESGTHTRVFVRFNGGYFKGFCGGAGGFLDQIRAESLMFWAIVVLLLI